MRINLIPQFETLIVPCSKGDNGRTFEFTLYNGAEECALNADSVCLLCSNGVTIDGTTSGSYARIDATAELTAKAGCFACNLQFTKGSERISTARFMLWVENV